MHSTGYSDTSKWADSGAVGGGGAALGTHGVFAAKSQAARAERYALRAVARALLPERSTLAGCGRWRRGGASTVDVLYSSMAQRSHFGGLQTCGLVWEDPVCAAKIAEGRRADLDAGVTAWRGAGGLVVLQSLTTAHRGGLSLGPHLAALQDAVRWMANHRDYKALRARYGLVGVVRGLESTWGPADGHHPHHNGLAFLEVSPGGFDVAAYEEELYRCYLPALERFGLTCSRARGVDVRATSGAVGDYLAKWGRLPERRPWGVVDELVKAHTKRAGRHGLGDGDEHLAPFELLRRVLESGALRTGESRYVLPWREFARAFHGRHQLQWTRGLRDRLIACGAAIGVEAATDGELAEEQLSRGDELLASLDVGQWGAVLALGRESALLDVADGGDREAVAVFVAGVVVEYERGGGDERAV